MTPLPVMTAASLKTKAFSLIELLVCIALISTLMTLAIPSLTVGTAASVGTGGSRLVTALTLARQEAMAKNLITAFVVETNPSRGSGKCAFAIFELPPRSDGSMPSKEDWQQATRWQFLPTNIVIDQCSFVDSSVSTLPAFPSFSVGGTPLSTYKYLLFYSNGGVSGDTVSVIRLVEGSWPKGASKPVYMHPGTDGSPANFFNISVLAATGKVIIDRP